MLATEPMPAETALALCRGMAAALEAERAALTEALGAVTHDYLPCCCGGTTCGCDWTTPGHPAIVCSEPPDHPAHQTPAAVRRRLRADDTTGGNPQ